MPPKRLSVIIITHNEERLLPGCLKSIIQWVDEIIVLDHNSTDKTCHIAKKAGAHIYHSNTWKGFGKQKQLAQKYATGDYILSLDADERISIQLKKSIISIIKKKNENTVYACTRRSLFLNRWMKYSGWYPDFVIRLYPKKYSYNSMKVHESLNINHATIKHLKGDLLHITCQHLPTFQTKQLRYAEIWALEHFQRNKKKKYNLLIIILYTLATFFKILLLNAGFLDGKYGVILAIIKSQYTFNKYIILWTLLQKYKKKH